MLHVVPALAASRMRSAGTGSSMGGGVGGGYLHAGASPRSGQSGMVLHAMHALDWLEQVLSAACIVDQPE